MTCSILTTHITDDKWDWVLTRSHSWRRSCQWVIPLMDHHLRFGLPFNHHQMLWLLQHSSFGTQSDSKMLAHRWANSREKWYRSRVYALIITEALDRIAVCGSTGVCMCVKSISYLITSQRHPFTELSWENTHLFYASFDSCYTLNLAFPFLFFLMNSLNFLLPPT